jgi:hypothetical protein
MKPAVALGVIDAKIQPESYLVWVVEFEKQQAAAAEAAKQEVLESVRNSAVAVADESPDSGKRPSNSGETGEIVTVGRPGAENK